MKTISASILLLLCSSFALADINTEYHDVLYGETPISALKVDEMYNKFMKHYKYENTNGFNPVEHYLTKGIDRKAIFANKLQQIIKHNSDDKQTYQKGLNAFSDMTD